jgi:hypothetical protein
MKMRVTKAGSASPTYLQLISTIDRAIIQPTFESVRKSAFVTSRVVSRLTKISMQPVAHGGIDAKMGAKKRDMKKQMPVAMAVSPVLPPSEIPAPDSMNAVTGEVPSNDPIEIDAASVQ